jgi:hypothetical protein
LKERGDYVRKRLLLIPILATLIVCLATTGVGGVPPTATIAVEPTWTYEPSSTEFTINLTVTDAVDTQLWEANVTFDPTILEVIDVAAGEFLKSRGFPTYFDYGVHDDGGGIYLGATYSLIAPAGWGVNGSGILANITFHVKNAEGATPIHLEELYTNLAYYNGTDLIPQPRVLRDGFFTILGDLNCNGNVGSYDLYLLARAYNTSVGNPGYNYLADLDGDDDVDYDDLNLYTENYGKTVGS